MQEIGAFEAKNRFGQLLDMVVAGEEIMITRHGKEVARLVPPHGAFNREAAKAAAEGIRALRKEYKLGKFDWEEWKSYRDEGRP